MSEMTMNVLDSTREVHQRVHGSEVDRFIAGLAGDPGSVDELELAVGRYQGRYPAQGKGLDWNSGLCCESHDAGIVFIDLVGKLVACESTYSALSRRSCVQLDTGRQHTGKRRTGKQASRVDLPYHVSDEWMFSTHVAEFRSRSDDRRQTILRTRDPNIRRLMYDGIHEFALQQMRENCHLFRNVQEDACGDFVREVHSRWLLRSQPTLANRSIRDRLLDNRHAHIREDLQNQAVRWSMLNRPPPAIPRESIAYQFGGFGVHEIVMYYDYVRSLLLECLGRVVGQSATRLSSRVEIDHLRQFAQDWLHGPQVEHLHGQTPASIIDNERRRLPEVLRDPWNEGNDDHSTRESGCPPGSDALDSDVFSAHEGPTFVHFGSENLDNDFAFSFHGSYFDWIEDMRRNQATNSIRTGSS